MINSGLCSEIISSCKWPIVRCSFLGAGWNRSTGEKPLWHYLQNSLNLLLLATSDYRSFFINIFIGCRSPVHQFFLFTKPKSNFLFCTFYWVTAMNNIPAQKKWNSSGLQNLWEDYVPANDSCLLSSLGDSLLKRPSDEECCEAAV